MNGSNLLIGLLSVTALVIGLAFLREVRLRKALQRLLAILLSRWRNCHVDPTAETPTPKAADPNTSASGRLRSTTKRTDTGR